MQRNKKIKKQSGTLQKDTLKKTHTNMPGKSGCKTKISWFCHLLKKKKKKN